MDQKIKFKSNECVQLAFWWASIWHRIRDVHCRALSYVKLCSIENFKFLHLTSYNSETMEFWANPRFNHFLSSIDSTYQNLKIIICLVSWKLPYFCIGLLGEENMVFRGRWQLYVFTKKFSSKFFDVYGSKTIENSSTQYCHWLYSHWQNPLRRFLRVFIP